MSNPSQLFLLADHIKLSLLERQRAISLNLEPNSQDGHISRSLESLRESLEALEAEHVRLEENNDPKSPPLKDQTTSIRTQYQDLNTQFHGAPASAAPRDSSTITQPNDPLLTQDFTHAQSTTSSSGKRISSLKRGDSSNLNQPTPINTSKSVRFTDNPSPPSPDPNRAALFPYRDDPADEGPPDQSNLSNQQIHTYHAQVLEEQDEQLDRLGESIGRQRQLSMQIGDELDGQVALLDEVDGHVDRHYTRMEGAKRRLTKFGKKAGENWGLTTIVILIVVLVFLIIILK